MKWQDLDHMCVFDDVDVSSRGCMVMMVHDLKMWSEFNCINLLAYAYGACHNNACHHLTFDDECKIWHHFYFI